MPDLFTSRCSACQKEYPTWVLTTCPMCKKVVCQKCVAYQYGRSFCSSACAGEFFHGDGDEWEGEQPT